MTTRKAKPTDPTRLTDREVHLVRQTLVMSWELIQMDIQNCCERHKELLAWIKANPGSGDEKASANLRYWINERNKARAYKHKISGLLAGISKMQPDGSFPLAAWDRAAKEAKRING